MAAASVKCAQQNCRRGRSRNTSGFAIATLKWTITASQPTAICAESSATSRRTVRLMFKPRQSFMAKKGMTHKSTNHATTTTSTLTSNTLLLHVGHEEQPEAARDNASLCNAPMHQPDKPTTHTEDDDDAEQPSAYQAHKENDDIVSSSSTEADDNPEASIFDTDDEDKDLRKNANTHLSNTMN